LQHIAAIKNYETRKIKEEDSEYLSYNGENDDVNFVAYFLEEKTGTMTFVGTNFNRTAGINERVDGFLREKYEYLGEEDGDLYFINSDITMFLVLTVMDDGSLAVLYMPYPPSQSSPALRSASDRKAQVEKFGKLFNKLKDETE
jgi:hypothetical protein